MSKGFQETRLWRRLTVAAVAPGGEVTSYRLYFMTLDGHITGAAEFECASDDEAKLYAEDQRDERPMERWCGARVVEKYGSPP